MLRRSIDHGPAITQAVRDAIRQAPLVAVRQLLTDREILEACETCGHHFRDRRYGPIVTVLHFVAQALQREESFAATWQELFTPVAAQFPGIDLGEADLSGLTHARKRLPQQVMQFLARRACDQTEALPAPRWRRFTLMALDGSCVSMPDELELHKHFGTHTPGGKRARYPMASFVALLAVGNSLIRDWRFGPYDPGEHALAAPLLAKLTPDDLLLADRYFAGAALIARVQRQGTAFLMRKHHRRKVDKLPVLKRLGRDDFITELPVPAVARRADASLPDCVRVRVFRACWTAPSGEKLREWFVTSLDDPRRFKKATLAKLYHERWRIETSYLEFKQTFGTDVLRSKSVANIEKEFAAHVLAYQLVRRLIVAAAHKHAQPVREISFLNAARWVTHFSHYMNAAPARRLPELYERLLDAIVSCPVEVRPGRSDPRMLSRDPKRYPMRRISRAAWRDQRLRKTG